MSKPDLIDRGALLAIFMEDVPNGNLEHTTFAKRRMIETVKNAPTIDAEPVRHGRWKPWKERFETIPQCSECGHTTRPGGYPYCPMCGAKMDAKEE